MITFNWLGRQGGLGNQLFQIAATIGVARRNGVDYAFSPWSYAPYFEHPLPQRNLSELVSPMLRVHTMRYFPIDVRMTVNLMGFFQSEKFFAHCADEIRHVFAPRQNFAAALQAQFSEDLRSRYGDLNERRTCAVHVRRGDYVGNANFFDLGASSYYENAFRLFDARTVFVVFSDDIPWCKTRFGEKNPSVSYVEGSDIASLFLMALCDDIVIANSTFSWWGAWLGERAGKRIVAPASWFAGPVADREIPFDANSWAGFYDTQDLIPDRWQICPTG